MDSPDLFIENPDIPSSKKPKAPSFEFRVGKPEKAFVWDTTRFRAKLGLLKLNGRSFLYKHPLGVVRRAIKIQPQHKGGAFKGAAKGQCLNCMDEREYNLTVPVNRRELFNVKEPERR